MASCSREEPRAPNYPAPTGRIEGTVRLSGESFPQPTRVTNTTDPEVCGREHTLQDLVVSAETAGIRDAIASLRDVPSARIPPREPERLVIDNVGCQFSPHAAVARTGATLEARNSDPLLHTTHLYGPANINISLPVQGARSTRTLERPGTYAVRCDIHGWMQALIWVDPHPFHAVTDERGVFRIERVPAGNYTLQVWHEKLGAQEKEVRVEDGLTSSVSFEFSYPAN